MSCQEPAEKPQQPDSRRRGASVGAFLWSQRLRPIWLLAGVGWVVFACFRMGLLIASYRAIEDVSASEIWRCLWTGMHYDAVPIGFAMLPLAAALSLAPAAAFGRRWFRRMVVWYSVVLITLMLLVEVVGAGVFAHFGTRMSWSHLAYFTHPRELMVYIWNSYPVWLAVIGIIVLPLVLNWALGRVFWRGRRPTEPPWARVLLAVILLALCVCAARGGFESHPIRYGSAYFSENNVVNQITLNNFFTLGRWTLLQLDDNRDEGGLYSFPDPARSGEITAAMILQPGDTPLPVPNNPLWRRTDTQRSRQDYNVVLILMEGMAGKPVGALGHAPSHTPNLDRLCREGLFFRRMYAVGPRTSRGLTGVLCGHPDMGGASILQREHSQGAFLTLPKILQSRGYRTMFIYGGDPEFDNMKGFFSAGGIETFIDETRMTSGSEPGNWGVPDEAMFRHAHRTFQQMGSQKFFAVILTVSNHKPYDVPLNRTKMLPHDVEENKLLNGYRYADWAIGEFFRRARKAEYFDRTIFVLVADHAQDPDRKNLIDVPGYRVPCLFYAPKLILPQHVETVASQTDIPPTLLAILGGSYEHCFFGRDMLKVSLGQGFALLHEGDRMAFVRADRALMLPPRRSGRLFATDGLSISPVDSAQIDPREVGALELEMLAYYQTARQVYFNRSYQRPARVQLPAAPSPAE